MTCRVIQVGTGGQGKHWCSTFLRENVDDERIEVVGAVDIDPNQHENAIEHLGLTEDQCYTEVEKAFEDVNADFCTVVIPPWLHEEVVDAAIEHDLDILSEKPIADTLEASVRIAEKVSRADVKMGVTMSHRFDQDKTSLRRHIQGDESGPLDYIVGRFTCNARSYGAWGAFRHEMEDVLMIEGAVHQLDFIADMAGSDCETIYSDTWCPKWAEYEGDVQAHVHLRFENGTRAIWEGAKANAVGLNGWQSDYVRAECRDETLVLDDRELVRYSYDPEEEQVVGGRTADGEPVALDEQEKWGNTWLVEQFVDWLDGGEPMATNVHDNLQSMALVEAAIRSSRTGELVDVQSLLADTRVSVEAQLPQVE
ncbi:Gfo/Idh/MocA family protein [Halegenticoccus tardaugens]|uniref:Gfo/Idh/MocA family protein n=1 Tax=Halegenticoccus tardaugens TaxID=2071624 RepID=UPI00100BC5C8|nr:Gfo/Idh/MocA family oxidoreductase [Halegenticoccus tardaugens]